MSVSLYAIPLAACPCVTCVAERESWGVGRWHTSLTRAAFLYARRQILHSLLTSTCLPPLTTPPGPQEVMSSQVALSLVLKLLWYRLSLGTCLRAGYWPSVCLCVCSQHILIVQRQLSVLEEELEEFRLALRQYMECACTQTGCLQSVPTLFDKHFWTKAEIFKKKTH